MLGGGAGCYSIFFKVLSETWGQIGIGFDFRLYWIVDFIQVLVETCDKKKS